MSMENSTRTRLAAIGVGISFLAVACSSYVPSSKPLVPADATLRFSLTDQGRAERFGDLGSQLVSLEGKVRATNDSAIIVAVSEVAHVAADNQSVDGETVTIPLRYVGRIERKHTQVARSALLAGAILGGVVWLGLQSGGGNVSARRSPGSQPPGQ
jgi:hypothetical protein